MEAKIRKIRVYNSGKISGLHRKTVSQKFNQADEEIKELGYKAINPLKTITPYWAPWFVHMIVDILVLLTCKKIYLQSDWNTSKGARIEKRVARWRKIEIILQSKYQRENAIRANEKESIYQEFKKDWLTNIKIDFGVRSNTSEETAIKIQQIAQSLGVVWRSEKFHLVTLSYPPNGFLYVCYSDRNNDYYFACGGKIEYFNNSREREIKAKELLEAWEIVQEKIKQLNK